MNRPAVATAAILAACAIANVAYADDASDKTRAELAAKKAELADRLNRIDRVAAAHGQYVQLRDGEILADAGLDADAAAFYTDATAWIAAWKVTIAAVDKVVDLSGSDASGGLAERIRNHEIAWTKLRNRALSLAERAGRIQASARALPTLGTQTVPVYKDQCTVVDAQRERLVDNTRAASALAGENVLDSSRQIASLAERIVTLRIQKAMASSPMLAASLADAAELFRADRIGAPLLASVYDAYDQLRNAINEYRPYRADTLRGELLAAATRARDTIAREKLGEKYAKALHRSIDDWQKAGVRLYDDAIKPYSRATLVGMHFTDSGSYFAAVCSDVTERVAIDCELFRLVYRIAPERIDTMTDAELRFLEDQMDKVGASRSASKVGTSR